MTRFLRTALSAIAILMAIAIGGVAVREIVAVRESISGLRTEVKQLESTVSDLQKDIESRRGIIPLISRVDR